MKKSIKPHKHAPGNYTDMKSYLGSKGITEVWKCRICGASITKQDGEWRDRKQLR